MDGPLPPRAFREEKERSGRKVMEEHVIPLPSVGHITLSAVVLMGLGNGRP